jgi:pimeloyl-ACP methyl ester carboxylesterase
MALRALLAALFVLWAAAAHAQDQRIAEIPGTRPGVSVRLLLVEPATRPHAAVLLFNGGPGNIRLWASSATPLAERYARGNFLLRSRTLFSARGLRVGAIDVPHEMREQGMTAVFRRSPDHVADMAAAVAALRGPEKLPVWLVGTSMGTVSAAAGAVSLDAGIDGLVLTSSITRPIRNGPNWLPEPGGIRDFALASVGVPVFVLGHAADGCWSTPPRDIPDLVRRFVGSRRVASRIVEGGLPPESEPCDALSAHGFYGIEREAVDAIADFIAAGR